MCPKQSKNEGRGGFQTRLAATLLVIFAISTAFIFHPFWADGQWNTFWKEISMIGGLLILLAKLAVPCGVSMQDAGAAFQRITIEEFKANLMQKGQVWMKN